MSDTVDFDRFFELHYQAMVRSLTAAYGSSEDASEAVQEAFIKAHARWGRIRRYDLPQAWVRRVAINRLRDVARKRRRHDEALGRLNGSASVTGPEPTHNPVLALLRELPERQRMAMALFYVEDLAVVEVAASMKISDGAVKAHLAQGRHNLRVAALANGIDAPPLDAEGDR